MSILTEYPLIMEDGTSNEGLIKHYSDNNVLLEQIETGAQYAEPVDIYPCPFTYKETDIKIEEPEEPEEMAPESE